MSEPIVVPLEGLKIGEWSHRLPNKSFCRNRIINLRVMPYRSTKEDMKIAIKISSKVFDNKRAIFFNEELSHHIQESELQILLKDAQLSFWKLNETDGIELGSRLFKLVNGSGRQLSSLLSKSYKQGEPLCIYFDIPFALDALPMELLFDKGFLLLNSQTHIIRNVTDRSCLKNMKPEKRMLKMLFVACSPIDLKDAVLEFEREEELMLKNSERLQVEMTIESSGSLEGLENALIETNGYDVVHITGHAGIDIELGPVFYMENDIGGLDKVTPDRLWDRLKDYPPRLLFLSGCSTGKSDTATVSESFAHLMVKKGIPVALGWGLPVSDAGATLLAVELYEYLAKGKEIDFAVQRARQFMEDKKPYHTWPLLRVLTDGSPLTPLIAPGQPFRQKTHRTITYKYLSDSHVKVLEYGFIGRRREIQTGIRVLKGYSNKRGLLICGPAGVGKSCLAGKLIEHFPKKELIVIHGEVNRADILQKLRRLFDRLGLESGLEIIKSNKEFEDKIKGLCRSAFKQLPTLIYFDNFEHNLIRLGDEYHVKREVTEILKPFLQAIEWSEGETNLLITSRYPFVMEVEGENLPVEKLEEITLMSFTGSDLEKKKNELQSISKSAHSDLYMEFGRGNPRLMESLEKIAEEEDKYDLEALKHALQGKNEEYIGEYLAEILAKTEGTDFLHFLRRGAVFRQPVDKTAFKSFGTQELLRKGVTLALFEREHAQGREPVYWVMPVIRCVEWNKLEQEEKSKMHQIAYAWYDAKISSRNIVDYKYLEEAVHHALESDNIRGACKHAIPLGQYLSNLLLYRERMLLQQGVADRITKKIIEESIKEKDVNVPVLFNALGLVWGDLGNEQKAIEYCSQSLEICEIMLGNQDPSVAGLYNNLGEAWRNLGDANKAMEYFTKALEIVISVHGDTHPNVAVLYNSLGLAWCDLGKPTKAIECYRKALEIDLVVHGDKHANIAIRYNNLGGAWSDLGDANKAMECFTKALEIVLAVHGDQHPYFAGCYNNIGGEWRNLGKPTKAIEYYSKALEIDLDVYGDQHPNLAIRYSNLGLAWGDLGEAKRAMEYYEKALEIDLLAYGDKHPNIAKCYNNLGGGWRDLGEAKRAMEYYEKALAIDLAVHGDRHPNVALRYNNLGFAWSNLKDPNKAIEYYHKALEIYLTVYGDEHPKIAVTYDNLGKAWSNLGDPNRAMKYYHKALEIYLAVYGGKHPKIAVTYDNLGKAWSNLEDTNKSIEYYTKALEVDLAFYGDKHPNVANRYNTLGGVCAKLGDANKAIGCFNKALEIDLAVSGDKHPNVAVRYNNLGRVWSDLGEGSKAVEYYTKALDIFTAIYGSDDTYTKTVQTNLDALKK